MKSKQLFTLIVFLVFAANDVFAQYHEHEIFDCYTILVGKNATVDGSVFLAHNEDDNGKQLVDWYKVPGVKHKKGEKVKLKTGAEIDQVEETYSYLWLEMPGMSFSDSYMNEWGVTVVSDGCSSRENEGEIIDGGIGYMLRRIMIERAKTAREAIIIAGEIIQKTGYASSGRTYCIADPNESWMMAVVKGKHWVAQRIPNDHVAIIPNYYTIGEIDLNDAENFFYSPDIVDYAIKKGWYDPSSGKEFNFRKAYAHQSGLNNLGNLGRHWAGINLLSKKRFKINDEFPFSFRPKMKISSQDLMKVLENHFEGSVLQMTPDNNRGNPHKNSITCICPAINQYGFVAQLRSNMPPEIGCVMWLAPRRPCIQPFIPWYLGITQIPDIYTRGDYQNAFEQHFETDKDIYQVSKTHAFWKYVKYSHEVDKNYGKLIGEINNKKSEIQKELFNRQVKFEEDVLKIYKDNPVKARKMLTDYTTSYAKKALTLME